MLRMLFLSIRKTDQVHLLIGVILESEQNHACLCNLRMHFTMNNNMFPPIKITLSFSLKVRWQNGSRFNFIIPIDKESIPTSKLLGSPTSFIIQPCLIQQAASGEYIPHFHKLQSWQWPRQGFHMNNVYEMCGEHFIFLRILPKRQQPVDYKAHGSQE